MCNLIGTFKVLSFLPFHFSPFIDALESSSIGVQNMALPKKIGICYGIPKLKPKVTLGKLKVKQHSMERCPCRQSLAGLNQIEAHHLSKQTSKYKQYNLCYRTKTCSRCARSQFVNWGGHPMPCHAMPSKQNGL